MYAWARPDYLLDHMSIEEVFMYYDYGAEFEEIKATMLISKLSEAMGGKKTTRRRRGPRSDKPDKAAFYKHYGDKIKRSDKGGEK